MKIGMKDDFEAWIMGILTDITNIKREDIIKIDLFTKIVLVVIAIALSLIALKPIFQIETVEAYSYSLDQIQSTGV